MNLFSPFFDLFNQILSFVLFAIGALSALIFSIVAYKTAYKAMFSMDLVQDDRFEKFYQIHQDDYSRDQAKQEYTKLVKLEKEFKYYHRQQYKKQLFYDRQDAYRYLKALDNYRFDDDSDDTDDEPLD